MTKLFIIKGRTVTNQTVYYTGKTGEQAITPFANKAQAFMRATPDSNAVRLAVAMNKGTAGHGITWEVAEK